jgi:hypothetical protein
MRILETRGQGTAMHSIEIHYGFNARGAATLKLRVIVFEPVR